MKLIVLAVDLQLYDSYWCRNCESIKSKAYCLYDLDPNMPLVFLFCSIFVGWTDFGSLFTKKAHLVACYYGHFCNSVVSWLDVNSTIGLNNSYDFKCNHKQLSQCICVLPIKEIFFCCLRRDYNSINMRVHWKTDIFLVGRCIRRYLNDNSPRVKPNYCNNISCVY